MFRKLMLGAVAAVGIGFGAQEATAGSPAFGPVGGQGSGFHPPRGGYDYVVLMRRGPHHQWQHYGRFDTLSDARRAERRLEREGFQVSVQEVRNGHR